MEGLDSNAAERQAGRRHEASKRILLQTHGRMGQSSQAGISAMEKGRSIPARAGWFMMP